MSRVLMRSLLALVLVAATASTGWRVLAPAEVLAPAAGDYPALVAEGPAVTGRTAQAPLIVDDRIRVYASPRQVRADGPVDAKTTYTARWSFRRWPQRLAGVVAHGTTVVTWWSDGALVAVDGRTGKIVWRVSGAEPQVVDGHRTGAALVWSPPGLHVGAGVVLVSGEGRVAAYDAMSGGRRWAAACAGDGFSTAGGRYVCPGAVYDVATGAAVTGWPVGASTPVGCVVAASLCTGMRDESGAGWLISGPAARRATALDRPGSTTAFDLVWYSTDDALLGAEPSGKVVRRFPRASVLGAAGDRLVLLTPGRDLLEVNPRTGTTLAQFPLAVGTERLTWNPGGWQVTPGHVAIERLTAGGPADPDAQGHYFVTETVIIAAT